MVTGKALWVDDDLFPVFEEAAQDYFRPGEKNLPDPGASG
jgi:hypothetical protein